MPKKHRALAPWGEGLVALFLFVGGGYALYPEWKRAVLALAILVELCKL
jgi:hypothetical protein